MVALVCNNLSVRALFALLSGPPQISAHWVFAAVKLFSGKSNTHQSMVNFILTTIMEIWLLYGPTMTLGIWEIYVHKSQ